MLKNLLQTLCLIHSFRKQKINSLYFKQNLILYCLQYFEIELKSLVFCHIFTECRNTLILVYNLCFKSFILTSTLSRSLFLYMRSAG